jgi:hypothetical protein
MSAARSGWERNATVAEIEDIALDIRARLERIEGETRRRTEAKQASDAFRAASE